MDFCLLRGILEKILVKIKVKPQAGHTANYFTSYSHALKIQRIAEATGDLIGNKIADKIIKVSKT